MLCFPRLDTAYAYKKDHFLFAKDIIKDGTIVKEYYLFAKLSTFLEINDQKHYYEVISGPQRLYMDIDIPITEEITKEKIDGFIDDLEKHIKSKYNTEVNIYSSHIKTKYSFHIIITKIGVRDNVQCKHRIEELLSGFENDYKKYIDMKVYRENQLLRLLGCAKIGKENTKIFIRGDKNDLESSLASNITDVKILDDVIELKYKILPPRLQIEKYRKKSDIK